MYYVKLNDNILPTPYQYIDDAWNEAYRLKSEMCAVRIDVVYIS